MSFRLRQTYAARDELRPRCGFTLVELMVAIVLITVGLLGSAALMATSLRYQRGASTREEMLALAEGKLDELRSYQIAGSSDTVLRARLAPGGSITSSVQDYADSLPAPGGKPYRRRWQIVGSVTGTREIWIRIEPRYTDYFGTAGVDLQTLVIMQ